MTVSKIRHTAIAVTAAAPLRISLAGGGTDLPSYYGTWGGEVVGVAIDRYVIVTVTNRSFGDALTTKFDDVEVVAHPALVTNRLARAAFEATGHRGPVQVASLSEVPSGAGLGSSGAFSVALLAAVDDMPGGRRPGGKERTHRERMSLGIRASDLEIVDMSRTVGRQDHLISSLGGLCAISFSPDGSVVATRLPGESDLSRFMFEQLLLVYIGSRRDAGKALASQDASTRQGDRRVVGALHAIKEIAYATREELVRGNFDYIGKALADHWACKQSLSNSMFSAKVQEVYRTAVSVPGVSGKLIGAGRGGFMLFYAPSRSLCKELRRIMESGGLRCLSAEMDSAGVTTEEIV